MKRTCTWKESWCDMHNMQCTCTCTCTSLKSRESCFELFALISSEYCIAVNFHVVQNFAVFADRSVSAKIKTAKIAASAICIAPHLPVCASAAKIKTAKISSGALGGNSIKFCTRKIFLLYGTSASPFLFTYMYACGSVARGCTCIYIHVTATFL